MPDNKPLRHAVSVVITNDKGETLFARRSPHKAEFPLAWSLPSHFMNDGEQPADTIARIAADKLGVELEMVALLNEGYGDHGDFVLFMHDYTARITKGIPTIISNDYVKLLWAKAEDFLPTLQQKGDCTRLYSEYITQYYSGAPNAV